GRAAALANHRYAVARFCPTVVALAVFRRAVDCRLREAGGGKKTTHESEDCRSGDSLHWFLRSRAIAQIAWRKFDFSNKVSGARTAAVRDCCARKRIRVVTRRKVKVS